jgi:hypothetical protein
VWLKAFVTATHPRLLAFSPLELSNLLWSVARMGWAPPLKYWERALAAAETAFPYSNAQDLAVTAYAGAGQGGGAGAAAGQVSCPLAAGAAAR